MWNPIRGIRRFVVTMCVTGLVFGFVGCSSDDTPTSKTDPNPLFEVSVDDFDTSESCKDCHPQHFEEWSGSRHAYSMKDPVWMAIRNIGQSAYANAMDGGCSPCHGTIGLRSGEIKWGPFDPADMPQQVQDGVGCDICHVITGLHGLSNAQFDIEPGKVKYGSIRDPRPNPAHESAFSSLYQESEYCGSCHDFILDNGTHLEAVFREWQEAGFALTGKTCSDCHMPVYQGRATPSGPMRTLHRHTMEGVDVVLIDDFPNKPEQLEGVRELLRNALLLEVETPSTAAPGQEFSFEVRVINDKTGHNVPSGVPFNRELWLSIVVRDGAGTLVYSSGQLDQNDDLMDETSDPDLFLAQATMLRSDSVPTGATWEAAFIDNPSLKPGETRVVDYNFTVPQSASGSLTVDVTLRFRPLPPKLLRNIDLAELLPIPIFDMAEATRTVTM